MATACSGFLRGHEVGVLPQTRVAQHPVVLLDPPFGRQPVVVEPHRVEDLVAPHPPVPGHRVGVGVREDMTDVQLARHRRRRGVDGEDPVPAHAPVEAVGPGLLPPGRPLGLEPLETGLFRHHRRPRSLEGRPPRRARRGFVHGRVTVPECCASTTQPPAPSSPRPPGARPGLRCTSAGPPSTTSPTSATAAWPWPSTSSVATSVLRPRGPPRLQHHRHRRQDHRPGHRRGPHPHRGGPGVRGRLVAALDGMDVRRPTAPPGHRVRRPDGGPRGRPRRPATSPTRPPTASTSRSTGSPATDSWPARPRLLRAGARVEPDEEKRSPRLRPLEEGQTGRADLALPLGQAARAGTPSASSCPSISWATASTSTAAVSIWPSPTTRTSGPRRWPLGRTFAHHWVHNGFVVAGGEKMSKSLGNFTSLVDLLERTDGRAYRLLLLRSHYRSQVEVTPDTVADAEEALVGLDALVRRFQLEDATWPHRRRAAARRGRPRGPGLLPGPHGRRPGHPDGGGRHLRAGPPGQSGRRRR